MDRGGGWQGPRLKSEAIDFAEEKLKRTLVVGVE